MTSESVEGFCPECNRMSALRVRSEAHATAPRQLFDQLDAGEDGLHPARYSIAFCPNARGAFFTLPPRANIPTFPTRQCSFRPQIVEAFLVSRNQSPDVRERPIVFRDGQFRTLRYHVPQVPRGGMCVSRCSEWLPC